MDVEKLKNIFGGEIIANEDKEVDFSKPIKGKYVAKVDKFERRTVETQGGSKDLISLKLKIHKDLEGEPSFNRMLDKAYWLDDSEYSTAQENIQKLANDLYTIGIFDEQELPDEPITVDNVDNLLSLNVVGKDVKVSCYKTKSNKQATRIVVLEQEEPSWT